MAIKTKYSTKAARCRKTPIGGVVESGDSYLTYQLLNLLPSIWKIADAGRYCKWLFSSDDTPSFSHIRGCIGYIDIWELEDVEYVVTDRRLGIERVYTKPPINRVSRSQLIEIAEIVRYSAPEPSMDETCQSALRHVKPPEFTEVIKPILWSLDRKTGECVWWHNDYSEATLMEFSGDYANVKLVDNNGNHFSGCSDELHKPPYEPGEYLPGSYKGAAILGNSNYAIK